ncbi:cytidine deaminase [Dolosicoccus paucivorans]|uniref:Cytidine deaminase n=1 Tax=Dolosicoccus paucivorans TaxID=84521 RepID=A0A2N6SNE3_9LACT|nr:cytidine deaminase [Dolosicoccus paucivorans]PMB84437.1 cytidine deaminase [Dolosicoccus paucivorans]PMC58572.1 cytidine deaminase [Dolosicoccus paucivorans]
MDKEQLVQAARDVLKHSYSPYSNFPVGAAFLTHDGKVYTGVNVENVSFGATNCAERSAIFAGISQGVQPKSFIALAIAGETEDFLPPCCLCRQVLVELCAPDMPVYLTRQDGAIHETTLEKLVPYAFETLDM